MLMDRNFLGFYCNMINYMIIIHNLIIGYHGKGIIPVINGKINQGSILTIIGENGIGKSTFLKTLAGLLSPTSGTIEFKQTDSPKIIGYLPQKKNMNYHFPITVFDVVSMGCWPRINFFRKINKYQKNLIWQILTELKLLNLLNNSIRNLSEGEFQRMLIARILVQQASFLLLDEPFQGIDISTRKTLMQIINKLCYNGCTIIIVLHNDQFLSQYFNCKTLLLTQTKNIWIQPK